jgi:UDP-N-acetylmuramate dehydrogenase
MTLVVRERVSLAPLTAFKLGGAARFFVSVDSVEALKEAIAFAHARSLALFILGGGANVLIRDEGFDGLVIKIEIAGIEAREGETAFIAGAGVAWDALVAKAVERGWWGIENLSGIPGTIGGACVQNIGAYGAALSQTLQWVEALDTREGSVRKFSNAECAFGYRESIFKAEEGRYVVLRAAFALSREPAPDLSYKDLALRFAGVTPSLADIRATVIEIRRAKFPDLAVEGTAGSFFKNPVVSQEFADALVARYPGLPLFSLPESTDIKVPLAWFLDHRHGVLDMRGAISGGARLYEKQPLVITATRDASARDVEALARIVQERVRAATALIIEPEVKML